MQLGEKPTLPEGLMNFGPEIGAHAAKKKSPARPYRPERAPPARRCGAPPRVEEPLIRSVYSNVQERDQPQAMPGFKREGRTLRLPACHDGNDHAIGLCMADITDCIRRLESGTDAERRAAESEIYKTFALQLRKVIEGHLARDVRQRVGPSDIYQEVMNSFFRREKARDFDRLADSRDLWAILFTMVMRRLSRTRKRHHAAKRDVRLERPLAQTSDAGGDPLDELVARRPVPMERARRLYRRGPGDAARRASDDSFFNKDYVVQLSYGLDPSAGAEFVEVYKRIKERLSETPYLFPIFERVAQSYALTDIAAELGLTLPTVKRKFGRVKRRLAEIAGELDLPVPCDGASGEPSLPAAAEVRPRGDEP
jgi:hypothetical protein